ncbi:hypothetical protein EDC04DRAFT_2605443 [Pisolithus marmoratus]|nr:hypothetical protein EDC04DRAFT_2605436 [Pisolithus marmoratus]KAI6030158.1 hypothetical protein EDC04DRAFT_2605443 [Pisolithus marmoratus]
MSTVIFARAHCLRQVFAQATILLEEINSNELVDKKAAFNMRDVELYSGTMQLDLSASVVIGVRAFKTAQMAQLTLLPLRDLGIGSSANHSVVLKRPYISDYPNEARPLFACCTLKDECNILYHEANTLYWAKALLQMTYQTGSAVNVTYLVKGFIPTSSDKFVKYTHNSNAEPCFLVDRKAAAIANFLAFTQHIQYIKTGGQVYISDYQGFRPLLTDPLILMHL